MNKQTASVRKNFWLEKFALLNRCLSSGKSELGNGENAVVSIGCTLTYLLSRCLDDRVPPSDLLNALNTLPFNEYPVERRLSIISKILTFLDTIGYVPQALEFSQQFLPPLTPFDSVSLANIARFQGDLLRQMGRLAEAAERQEAAAAVFKKNNLLLAYIHCLNNLGSIEIARNDMDLAVQYLTNGLNELAERKAPVLKGHFHNNLAVIALIRGQYQESQAHLTRALIFRRQGQDLLGITETLFNLSHLNRKLGKIEQAQEILEEAMMRAGQLKQTTLLAHIQVLRAEIFIDAHDSEPANVLIESALRYYQTQSNLAGAAECLRIRGRIRQFEERLSEARQDYEEAARLSLRSEYKLVRAQTLESLAELERRDHPATALNLLGESAEIFRSIGAEIDSERVETLIKELVSA